MKIQVASFSSTGGAGNVGRHLTYGFQQLGIDASFYSAMESNLRAEPLKLPLVTAAAGFDNYIAKSKYWPSLVSLTRDKVKLPLTLEDDTDALILRWGNGLLNQDLINKLGNRTLVLGLDDMNYFTGACHYAGDCTGFHESCSNCPCVKGSFRKLVSENLERKKRLLGQAKNLKVVAPTQWIKEEFDRSSFSAFAEANLISNPIDPVFFEETGKREVAADESTILNLLIVAADLDDPIKGVEEVWPLLEELIREEKITLALVGKSSKRLRQKMYSAKFRGTLGPIELLSEIRNYEVLLVPSMSENAGTVLAEAASQGLPAIGRKVGGLINEIGENGSGWLFSNLEDLEVLLRRVSKSEISERGAKARKRAERYAPSVVANNYATLL